MPRRPIILDPRTRFVFLCLGGAAAALAASTCLLSLSYPAESANAAGQPQTHTFTISRGVFTIEKSTWPIGTVTLGRPRVRSYIYAGFEPTLYRHELHFSSPAGAMAGPVFEEHAFGLAPMLLLGAAVCAALILPLRRVPRSECVCGYRLEGVVADICPECERPLVKSSETPRV